MSSDGTSRVIIGAIGNDANGITLDKAVCELVVGDSAANIQVGSARKSIDGEATLLLG
jgi:hypothetical protein